MSTSTSISTFIRLGVKSLGIVTVAAAVTLPALSQASTVPGQIVLFAGECPGGFLPADGSSIDLAAYPELTSVVLNSYGTGEDEGTINLPTADSSAVGRTYNYVYSSDETQSLSSRATSYLVKVRDDRDSLEVVEVVVGNRGGSSDPQEFVRYVTSFEMETGTTVENYAIRTGNGFALPNGADVSDGEKDSYWFGEYCSGNGNCKNSNKSLITIALSDLTEGDLQGGFPTPPPRQMAGDDDTNSDFAGETELPEGFAPFQPTYCVAVGGDTAPLVEVGLSYTQESGKSGFLDFQRIDVSGYTDDELAGLPAGCFENGDLCLDQLEAVNPGITRPNIAFRLVGENICTAYESVSSGPGTGCGSTTFTWSNGQEFCEIVSPYTDDLLIALGGGPGAQPTVTCQAFGRLDLTGFAPDLDGFLCEKLGGTYNKDPKGGSSCGAAPEFGSVVVDNTISSAQEFCAVTVNSFLDDEGLCGANLGIPPKLYNDRCAFAGGEPNFDTGFSRCVPPGYNNDAGFPQTYCLARDFNRFDDRSGIGAGSASGGSGADSEGLPYPAELVMSGLQISRNDDYPTDEEWGNDFDEQREALLNGGSAEASPYAYITKRDENGRPGFVAADLVDERTLILENRNTIQDDFFYRVQAQCGDGTDAYNVYYDPRIQTSGGGDSSWY